MSLCGGAKCRNCGCDDIDLLEFNHKDGNGCKEWRLTKGVPIVDRILTLKRKTDDLEVLCRVCNALDFLERKKKGSGAKFKIIYEDYTGKIAQKISG